jgi:hypothetical protein
LRSRSRPSPASLRTRGLDSPRLARLARSGAAAPAAGSAPTPAVPGELPERCELCGEPLPAEHRHLLDRRERRLLCACRACSLLFDRRAAGAGHYRLVPERRRRLEEFMLDDATWEQLRIPVELAFFFHSSAVQRMVAFYPSPMGATESRLELAAWDARGVARADR